MSKTIALVIASENFRDEEYFVPKTQLEKAGYTIHTVSSRLGNLKGMLGGTALATHLIEGLAVDSYLAVVFIGGSGAKEYFNLAEAHRIALQAFQNGIIIAAICIAPIILANAGILKGKKATWYKNDNTDLTCQGAIFTGKGVEQDGTILTASGPASATDFARALIRMLKN